MIVGAPPVVSAGPSVIGMTVVPGVKALTVVRVLKVLLVSVARSVAMTGGLVAMVDTARIGIPVPRVATVVRVVRVARVGLRSGRETIVGAPPVASAVRTGTVMIVLLVLRAPPSVGRSVIVMIVVRVVRVLIGGLAVRVVTAPIVLVPRVRRVVSVGRTVIEMIVGAPPVVSAGRSGTVTTVGLAATSAPTGVLVPRVPPVASVGRSGIAMIVVRVVKMARVGLRSGRETIVGAPPVASADRSGMTGVPGEKADIRAMTVRGRSHGIHVMSVPTAARVRGTAGTTVRRTPRRASRCPSLSRTSRLMSSTRKCVRSSAPCPTTWRSWSAGT
jgi:hypothetical protein